ncbi:3'-5' exonuclease [Palleronia sp. KMU-117]|uniref:3'-5' exonuclease n=1 Tax=Palleronia sp. KMU-117 TaxID=3434108 RepID=UPI003D72562E
MTWFKTASDLSQLQLRVVEQAVDKIRATPDGAVFWVQGGAGSGKTIVLAHIARRLKAENPGLHMVFLTYTHALAGMIHQAVRESGAQSEVDTYLNFLHRSHRRVDVILLDEIQDVKRVDIEALRQRCTHLVVAGDCEQRIYEVANTEAAIDEVIQFEKGRLLELFRITRFIVRAVKTVLPSTHLAESDVRKLRDVTAVVKRFDSSSREARWTYEEAFAMARPKYPSAILLPNHRAITDFCYELAKDLGNAASYSKIEVRNGRLDYRELNSHFDSHRIPVRYFGNGIGDLADADGRPLVFIMTYHSSKGLDFDVVHMPGLVSSMQIVPARALLEAPDLDRTVFFVAMTRSRERLVMTYSGTRAHPLVEGLPRDAVAFSEDVGASAEVEEDLF